MAHGNVQRRNWYDGRFYSLVLDSDNSAFRKRILAQLDPGKRVLDVGCGTGGLALQLARKSNFVAGIDISGRQIETARHRQNKAGLTNLQFIHADILEYSNRFNFTFDYAVISFVLHEVAVQQRVPILNQIKKLTDTLIILDYNIPHPWNGWGVLTRLIEFMGGRDHYKNFRTYVDHGGLQPLLDETAMTVKQISVNRTRIFALVVTQESDKQE